MADRTRTVKQYIQVGALTGAVAAALFSAWATVVVVFGGGGSAESTQDFSLHVVVAAYFASITLGGALAGACLALFVGIVGQAAGGLVVGYTFACGIAIAGDGPPWAWPTSTWEFVGLMGLVYGIAALIVVRRAANDG